MAPHVLASQQLSFTAAVAGGAANALGARRATGKKCAAVRVPLGVRATSTLDAPSGNWRDTASKFLDNCVTKSDLGKAMQVEHMRLTPRVESARVSTP